MNDERRPASAPGPIDPVSGEPLPQRAQPGYYPGYSTLDQQRYWDAATRAVVLERVDETPPIRFFEPDEARFWSVVFEHLLPQTDRTPQRRIPLVEVVDRRLYREATNGYRFTDMPPDRDAYRLGRDAIDQEASDAYGALLVDLPFTQRDDILKRIHDGVPRAARTIWERMSVHRFWQLIMSDAVDAYYALPWAWDEIGFGGPAYPRAYVRLERGQAESWEVDECRYAWSPPPEARSADVETTDGFHTESEQHRSHAIENGGS